MTHLPRRNLVAKHSGKFNKTKVFKDRKKEAKKGYKKHRHPSTVSESEG